MIETKINSKKTFVEYRTSPKPEGLLYLCIAALFAILATLFLIFKEMDSTDRIVVTIISYGAVVWMAAFGVYYRYFRYKPLKRNVILGNHMHRMYLRNRLLFMIYAFLLCTICYVVTIILVDFLWNGFSLDKATLIEDFRKVWGLILFIAPYRTATEYLGYRQYYICRRATAVHDA